VAVHVGLLHLCETRDARLKNLIFLGPAILAGWAGRALVRIWNLGAHADPAWRSERAFAICSWVVGISFLFIGCGGYRDWSCPHGWARGLGPVGVAYSAVGGPCRNYVPNLQRFHVTGNWYVWFDGDLGEY
jgi:hypothetical protein